LLPARLQFVHARSCYGHLAGVMAVRLLEAMLKNRWLTADGRDYAVTRLGETKLRALDIDVAALREGRRVFARACLDLTERRDHLGGALGEALLDAYVCRGWIERRRGSRAVDITRKGEAALRRVLRV
jgi:hypothetical protein